MTKSNNLKGNAGVISSTLGKWYKPFKKLAEKEGYKVSKTAEICTRQA